MRRVEVCRGDGQAAMEVQVEETASLQEIMDSVARTCGVSNDFIRISLDGKRARALQDVPTVGQVVTAAVRSEELGTVTKRMEEISIPPKPVVMHQDMEGFNDVVAFDEIIDNSIRAQAATITFGVVAAGSGAVDGLACLDDGVGMSRSLALNHMRLAHTDSGIVTAPRQPNKPLAAALYFSKELSRHGKGAAALLHFGHVVKTTTKVQDAAETTTVLVNYKDWDGEYQATGTCSYKVRVTDIFNFVETRDYFTDIIISDLKEEVALKLADRSQHRRWAQQVYDTYIFFIQGFPQALWASLPADLQPSAQPGRPAGGLTIDLFGIKLSQSHQLPPQVPRPRLSMLVDTFLDLSQQFRQGGGRPGGIVPFWLPIRWCEPGMKPQQVPENVRVERRDETGPAGKLQGVHRDFLLLLLYYPYKEGQQTKPVLIGDAGAEDLMYTAWCGRLIPKAFSTDLPPLVAEAAQSTDKGATAWRLTSSRLCAVLFCSPEVYTSNHKTELFDAAYDAVLKRLGAPSSRRASEDDLFVWSREEHSWLPSGAATRLLLKHHKSHWAALEEEGEILEVIDTLPNGAVIGRTFKLPGGGGTITAGDLVRLVTAEERKAAGETASSSRGAGSSQARRGGGGSGGSGGNSSGAAAAGAAKGPVNYRVVKHFKQHLARGGHRVMALLQEWQPSWVTGEARENEHAAALIDPVDPRQAEQLLKDWEASAPRHLAWWDPTKAGDAKVVLDILELTGVQSGRQITAAQVPPSVAVCYVNAKKQLVNLTRAAFWSQTIALNSEAIAVMWELQKASSTGRGAGTYSSITGNRNTAPYTQASKAQIQGWQGHVQEPGRYRLHIKSCCPWVPEPLQYDFEVAALEARELDAVWDTAGQPCIRLGEELPTLVVRAKDASGKFVTLPFNKSPEVVAAVALAVKGSDDSTIAFVNHRGFEAVLMHDRKTFKLKGFKLAHQPLRLQGNTPVQARIVLKLKLPVTQEILVLADQDAPTLLVLSGPPSKLEARSEEFQRPQQAPHKGAEVARGSRVQAVKLFMLDDSDNKILDAGDGEAYCARVRFEPPFAAVRAKALGSNSAAEATPAALGSRRRKSGTAAAAAAAAGAAAAAADQARVGWPIHVDGNIVEIEDEFRWRLPPGAGPAAIVIEVYAGKTLPPAADAQQPLLQHRGWYAMQEMHSGVKHPSLDDLQPAVRWDVWKGKHTYDWSQGLRAFELNTGGFAGVDRHVPTEATAAVPDEVLERFAEGFEARSDVVAGQLCLAFITPFGSKLSGAAPAGRLVREKVPFFLADYWNRLLGDKLVYQVAFVVPATQQQLSGVQLELCNESDAHDNDFGGRAKLVVQGPGISRTPVFDDETQLEVAGGLLSLPPIAINPDWFTADNKGTVMLLLLDDEPFPGCDPAAAGPSNAPQLPMPRKEELGRFTLRLAPAAEQLLVMAAGPLFNEAEVLLKGPPGGPQGSRQKGKAQQDGQQDRSYVLKQQHVAAAGASSSRKAAAGAWSPWECVPAQRGPRTNTQQLYIDPRHMELQRGLRLQLGQPLTLHFVATDFLGCPVELSKQQRKDMVAGGVQLTPYDGSASLPVLVEDWKWGSSQVSTAGASAMQSNSHLGGPFVNSCTFMANRGCGEAELSLSLTGSFGRVTTLRVPVLLEAGPVAVDGLRLQHADVAPQLEATTAHHSCCSRGFMDLHSGQLLDPPEDAAVEVHIKQEPGLKPGLQDSPEQHQQPQPQERQSSDGSEIEVIEILTTEEEEDGDGAAGPAADGDGAGQPMDVDQQRPLSARQQWLSCLGPGAAGLLFELEGSPVLIEGSAVKLQLQLYDSAAHEVAADKRGRLQLRWARNWQAIKARQEEQGEQGDDQQEPQQQQDQQQLEWESLGEAAIAAGQAKPELRLGIGDEWCGEQLFQVLPVAPSGSELAGVLPVLLKVQVAPGPFPHTIYVNNLADVAAVTVTAQDALPALMGSSVGQYAFADLAAALQFGTAPDPAAQPLVIALPQLSSSEQGPAVRLPPLTIQLVARDGSTLAPSSLQPLRVQLEAWELPGAAADGAAGTWLPVHGPGAVAGSGGHTVTAVLQELQLESESDDAQLQHQQVVYEVPLACRQLPPVAGLYRLQAEYSDNSLIGAETLSLHVGPFLLLPGPPAKLELAAAEHPQQQQQAPGQSSRSRATSSTKRRGGRGPTAAAAAAGDDRQQLVAPPEHQVVILQELPSTYSVQQTVQLRDCWGNAWRPAAEALSARLSAGSRAGAGADDTGAEGQEQEEEQPPQKRRRTSGRRATADAAAAHDPAAAAAGGAGGGENWSVIVLRALKTRADAAGSDREEVLKWLITTLPFDEDGCCTVIASSLSALGLGSREGVATVGEWQLLGQAVPIGRAVEWDVGSPAAVPLQVVLGSWHIASQHTADLRKQEVRLQSALRQKETVARDAAAAMSQQQQELQRMLAELRKLQAEVTQQQRVVQQRSRNVQEHPRLLQLQQEVASAAPRAEQLAAAAGGRRLLDRPWMRAAERRSTVLRPMTDQEVNASQMMPPSLMQLHQASPSVLGPMVTLGSVECADVAAVLSALLRSDLQQLVCLNDSEAQQLRRVTDRDYTALHLPELFRFYHALPRQQQQPGAPTWLLQHPQKLLPPTAYVNRLLGGVLDLSRYDARDGFVGVAANLVHLNQQQLGLDVTVNARRTLNNDGSVRLQQDNKERTLMTLRETLWAWKLGTVLVFETEAHITRFRTKLHSKNRDFGFLKAVALDGSTFNVKVGSMRHRLPVQDVSLRFGPAGRQAADNPLDLRLRYIKELGEKLQQEEQALQQQQAAATHLDRHVQDQQRRLTAAQRKAKADHAAIQKEKARLAHDLGAVQEELQQREQTGMRQ